MRLGATIGLLALVGACSREQVWPPSPASLLPGEDACAECRMIVSDVRFAVQLHTPAGPLEWFDDLGCLVQKHGPDGIDPQGVFVRAFDAEVWVRGDQGHVLRKAAMSSPMGYGWCTFETLEAAQEAAARHPGAETVALDHVLRAGPKPPSQAPSNQTPETSRRN